MGLLWKPWLGVPKAYRIFVAMPALPQLKRAPISECKLASEKTRFVLALCGDGFHWHEDQLEDFVEFYFTGRHRPDDAFGNAEARHITEKCITLSRSISLFACMNRQQGCVDVNRLNWNVQPPPGPLFPV